LRERIVFRRDASPVTFRRYAWTTFGAVYGPDGVRFPRRGPALGLAFAGAATHGPGVEAAMISGAEAADALLPGLLAQARRLPSDRGGQRETGPPSPRRAAAPPIIRSAGRRSSGDGKGGTA
jgi:hypothetical protein